MRTLLKTLLWGHELSVSTSSGVRSCRAVAQSHFSVVEGKGCATSTFGCRTSEQRRSLTGKAFEQLPKAICEFLCDTGGCPGEPDGARDPTFFDIPQQLHHVLNRCRQVLLDLLAPEPAPAGPLEPVAHGLAKEPSTRCCRTRMSRRAAFERASSRIRFRSS